MRNISCLFFILVFSAFAATAQEDLLSELDAIAPVDSSMDPKKEKVYDVFFGNRLINGHSTEMLPKKTLEFIIAHRFGRVNSGFYEFFGLDFASMRIGFQYSPTDWLAVGVGRSTFLKTYDGYVKARILEQKTSGMPVSLVALASMAIDGRKELFPDDRETWFTQRMSYTYQLLLSRKFCNWFSMQLMPTVAHYNLVTSVQDKNTLFLMGAGARFKITRSFGLTTEYYARIKDNQDNGYKDAFAVGIDLTTGGHVFQIQLTNAQAMYESGFLRQTNGNFWKGDIHLGFNITRNFGVGNRKKDKAEKAKMVEQ